MKYHMIYLPWLKGNIHLTSDHSRLTNETDIKSYQGKLRDVEKANEDLQSKLTKKEREAEARNQEKEELLDTVNKMKSQLEESKQQIAELGKCVEDLKLQVGLYYCEALCVFY